MFSGSWGRLFALAALTGVVSGQALPACGQTCYTSMLAKFGSLGCTADTPSCLCKNPDFGFGIRDCALQACGAEVASSVTGFASSLCATATVVAAATNPPAPAATTTPSVPTSSPVPSSVSSSSSIPLPTSIPSSSSSSVLIAPGTSSTASLSSSSSQASSSSSSSSTLSSSISLTTLLTSARPSSATQTSADPSAQTGTADSNTVSSGLSTGAKIGIGVGVALGAVALLGVVVCLFCLRRRRPKTNQSLQISNPLPGSGRTYAEDHEPFPPEKGHSELEQRSQRYEELLPRTAPARAI